MLTSENAHAGQAAVAVRGAASPSRVRVGRLPVRVERAVERRLLMRHAPVDHLDREGGPHPRLQVAAVRLAVRRGARSGGLGAAGSRIREGPWTSEQVEDAPCVLVQATAIEMVTGLLIGLKILTDPRATDRTHALRRIVSRTPAGRALKVTSYDRYSPVSSFLSTTSACVVPSRYA